VGSVFRLMQEYALVWMGRKGSQDADLFGFRFGVGLDPIEVNTERMLNAFKRGYEELGEVWSMALSPETYAAVDKIAYQSNGSKNFVLDNDLWSQIVLDFAVAYKREPVERGHLLRSLTPLYLARVASFVLRTSTLTSDEVEDEIERLCVSFEQKKPEFIRQWCK
jgi:glucosylglycerate synthase